MHLEKTLVRRYLGHAMGQMTTGGTGEPETGGPNEELAKEVVGELLRAGLIKPSRAEQVRAALLTGKCRVGDWKSWALISLIAAHHQTLKSGREEAKACEKLHLQLAAIHQVVKPLRQRFVRKVLASVSSECDRLYALMHPNEPLGGISLDVDQNKRASCSISALFCGKSGVPPQAYYSESHADTLGFALFLALTKRRTGGDAILVFDDIFSSADEGHLENICNLIAAEATQFRQVIFATHSRRVYDWLHLGKLPAEVFGVVELSPQWSLSRGIEAR